MIEIEENKKLLGGVCVGFFLNLYDKIGSILRKKNKLI